MNNKKSESYFLYWGKAKKEQDEINYHLLPYHCLDVVAVSDVWLSQSKVLLKQIASHLKVEAEKAKSIVLFFVALHDLGKFDARFQEFVPPLRKALQGKDLSVEKESYDHGSVGYLHFRYDNRMHSEPMKAVAGHHGYCDTGATNREPSADEALINLDQTARSEWIDYCLKWQGLEAIPDVDDIPMLAGLCSVSDWVGSSMTNFTTDPGIPLQAYYKDALARAEVALKETGIMAELQGAGFDYLFPGYKPRGVQTLLSSLSNEAGLTLVEADTGSGKTEFALAYASQLIQSGFADGIVFGLPTQATANGLFARIGEAAEKLFPQNDVTLAHGKSKYLLASDENGFLHRSTKRAFLGTMSVATIDQILMGVLGVKHQFIRSFGTRKSVLILDEIHSFDAYMYGLIEQVLKGQCAAFSSVILLSATLPKQIKTQLLRCYKGHSEEDAYPLVTQVNLEGNTHSFKTDVKPKVRTIDTQMWLSETLLPDSQSQTRIINWVEQGAMVCIICNTVNDAQQLYQLMQDQSDIPIDLFHARFTFHDRHRIERSVLKHYGKESKREGRLLIATQVVEQSLDLDFDVLISQIAPIEFLMQRMGRLWRHDRDDSSLPSRTKAIKSPLFITLAPIMGGEDAGIDKLYRESGYVYGNRRLLYRTQHYLAARHQLTFPDCYREAIDYVHHDKAYDNEPDVLSAFAEQYVSEQSAALFTARKNSNLDSRPLNDVDPRCAMLTREGEMSTSVVLFKEDGSLLHGGDYQNAEDRDKSTVSLSKKLAKGKKDPDYHCLKALVNKDLLYSSLGVTPLNE